MIKNYMKLNFFALSFLFTSVALSGGFLHYEITNMSAYNISNMELILNNNMVSMLTKSIHFRRANNLAHSLRHSIEKIPTEVFYEKTLKLPDIDDAFVTIKMKVRDQFNGSYGLEIGIDNFQTLLTSDKNSSNAPLKFILREDGSNKLHLELQQGMKHLGSGAFKEKTGEDDDLFISNPEYDSGPVGSESTSATFFSILSSDDSTIENLDADSADSQESY